VCCFYTVFGSAVPSHCPSPQGRGEEKKEAPLPVSAALVHAAKAMLRYGCATLWLCYAMAVLLEPGRLRKAPGVEFKPCGNSSRLAQETYRGFGLSAYTHFT
jgi:hypothetical protein